MKNYSVYFIPVLFVLASCGGGDTTPEPPPQEQVAPSATTLIFPENNTECNEGTIVNDTQSSVQFQWNASENTDLYELNIKNINSGAIRIISTSDTQVSVNLTRGIPFEWFVVSKANGINETASSLTWKFYNAGPGIENYAPFPADAVSPARGSTISAAGTVNLVWIGSDVDNDIIEYEVYLDTNPAPEISLGTTTESTIETTINSNTVYFWKIITRDAGGNSSDSEIFQFKTQ